MKLKTKLLTIITPAALLTTVAPIALTSCGGGSSTTTTLTYSGNQTQWTITGQTTLTLNFKLSKALADGEKLSGPTYPESISEHDAHLKGATWSVNGLDAVATLTFSGNVYTQTTPKAGSYVACSKINFTIVDKTGATISTATISNFKVSW